MRARRYLENTKLQRRITELLANADGEFGASSTVEEQIYEGFYSKADQRLLDQFHVAPWPERWRIARQFEDKRLKQLARRLIYLEQPDALPAAEQAAMARKMAARMLGHEKNGDWTCLPTAMKELRLRWREADEAQRVLLTPLRAYLLERRKWARRVHD